MYQTITESKFRVKTFSKYANKKIKRNMFINKYIIKITTVEELQIVLIHVLLAESHNFVVGFMNMLCICCKLEVTVMFMDL